MQALIRVSGIALTMTSLVTLVGCSSTGKHASKKVEEPITVTVEAPVAEKDALGNYRFLMQEGESRMSADQFDAWMKANGIRVAKGAPAPAATPTVKAGKN